MTSAMAGSSSTTMMSPRSEPSELMPAFSVAIPAAGWKRVNTTPSDSTFTGHSPYFALPFAAAGLPTVKELNRPIIEA
jgi:hypothetical protein